MANTRLHLDIINQQQGLSSSHGGSCCIKIITTMTRFYFRIYQNGDEDGDNIWVDAMTESEARQEVEHEYWGIDRLELIRTQKL